MARVELHSDAGERIAEGNTARLLATAERVAEEARRMAPVVTGDYRDSIEAVIADDGGERVGRVVARDWKAGFIEFGVYGRPVHAPIRRAAEATGLRVVPR